ncbi:MAG: peptide chain release factor N(5)-glutamine methyltransferase [Bacteroidetes bacterium]|nr:peptide chain release factor N(5)-glutamine methyltransferase [Bacteroidota bacterium]
MGVKLQTIGETKRLLAGELRVIYPPGECNAVISLLVEAVTGLNHIGQLKESNRPLNHAEAGLIQAALPELLSHKPVQHITGYGWFMGRKFAVNGGVLIPRQETEELVFATLQQAGMGFSGTIIDFCTGSGCIAVTLACMLKQSEVWATELYSEPLEAAARNISNHSASVNLVRHDLLSDAFGSLPAAGIMVANPPYVRNSEKAGMKPNVLNHEPHGALFVSDTDPLVYYRALLEAVNTLLEPGGWFCFEINEALGRETLEIFSVRSVKNPQIINDINSKNRFISGTRC